LEHQWAIYDSHDKVAVETKEENVPGEPVDRGWLDAKQEDMENLNDCESLDLEEMKKSSIY
jgi:hypothetical protein